MAKKSSSSGTRRSTGARGGRSGGTKGKASGGRSSGRRASAKRELINTGSDKRFVRRGSGGQFKESDDVGRSLGSDRRRKAKTVSKPGQGDRGDRKSGR